MEEIRKINSSVRHLRLIMGSELETRAIGTFQFLNSMNHISRKKILLKVTHQFVSDPRIHFIEN